MKSEYDEHNPFPLASAIYDGIISLYYYFFVRPKVIINLNKFSSYYRKLGRERDNFVDAVCEFIKINNFVGRGDLKVSVALKSIIAAHAVQLSFRLPAECYDYYQKIIIYKDYYHSKLTGKLHKAEVNPAMRLIVFSVRAIHESINRDNDGLNVLLHEFAHALWLEHLLKGDEYVIFNRRQFDIVRSYITRALVSGADDSGFLRRYAFTNEAEFFAVAVENFFERPLQFKKELPEFYSIIAALFRQEARMPPC